MMLVLHYPNRAVAVVVVVVVAVADCRQTTSTQAQYQDRYDCIGDTAEVLHKYFHTYQSGDRRCGGIYTETNLKHILTHTITSAYINNQIL